MRLPFLSAVPGRPLFVAHRGASDRALENSPSAFVQALADGADMIEFDIRLSADGVPVVLAPQPSEALECPWRPEDS